MRLLSGRGLRFKATAVLVVARCGDGDDVIEEAVAQRDIDKHLGIFASFGVLLSLLYTIVLLPALLAIIPIKSRNAKEDAGEEKQHD